MSQTEKEYRWNQRVMLGTAIFLIIGGGFLEGYASSAFGGCLFVFAIREKRVLDKEFGKRRW